MMEDSHDLFMVSHTLHIVFPDDVAARILESFLNTRYEQQQHPALTWPYRGWISPKPDFYECFDDVWRRMPRSHQDKFLTHSGGLKFQWQEDAGWDLADFDRYREWLKRNDPESNELMPRVDDFCNK
jgi:hypothetical protein